MRGTGCEHRRLLRRLPLWATLTGKAPYAGTSDYQIVHAHLESPVPQLPAAGPLVDGTHHGGERHRNDLWDADLRPATPEPTTCGAPSSDVPETASRPAVQKAVATLTSSLGDQGVESGVAPVRREAGWTRSVCGRWSTPAS